MVNNTLIYTRENPEYNYTHEIFIMLKTIGKTYVLSCQDGINKDGLSNATSLTPYEMKLFMKRAKKFERKNKKMVYSKYRRKNNERR